MEIETDRLTPFFKTQFFYSLDMQLDNEEMCNIHSIFFLTRLQELICLKVKIGLH